MLYIENYFPVTKVTMTKTMMRTMNRMMTSTLFCFETALNPPPTPRNPKWSLVKASSNEKLSLTSTLNL